MKRILCILIMTSASFLAFAQVNTRINSLQQEIDFLTNKVDSLQNRIHNDIIKNGYSIIAKSPYSYYIQPIILKDTEYGSAIDTIASGDSLRIIDKTIGCFKD